MKKTLLILSPLILVAILIFYFVASTAIGRAVKYGVETLGPQILGVSVIIDSVNISPFNGSVGINGLIVGNPEGYSNEKAFSFDEISISLAPLSVFSEVVHIKEIRIIAPEFVYEKKLTKSNISELLKNLEALSSDKDTDTEEASDPVRFKIDKLVFADGSIKLATLGVGATLPLPSMTLEEIGKEEGIAPDQAVTEVLKSVFSNVIKSVAKAPGAVIKGGKDTIKNIGGKIKSLFGK